MMKHLKRFVAITISMVMAFQFCTNDFYLYAETEPADPGQTQVTNEPESEPSDSTGEAAEETPPSDIGTPEPSAPVEEQPAAPVEEQPAPPMEEQPEVASTLKVEFVDVSNASVKETVEQALTSKYVGKTINLDELGIDINVEGYTLTEVKDKNDNTQVYTTETKDFVLTGNVTELQFVYTQNVQTDQPEDSQEPSTPQGGQEDQNSEEDQEDTDDEDSDSQTNEGEDESADSSKDDELAYPEQILSVTASDGAIITIIAKEGALPEGAEVVVEPVESDSIAQIVEDALSQEGKELQTYKAYDITILLDGEEIQPKVPIQVGITGSGVTGSEKSLFHIEDGSSQADKVNVIDSGSTQTFSAEGFSIYVVASGGTNVSSQTDIFLDQEKDYQITLSVGETITLSHKEGPWYHRHNWRVTGDLASVNLSVGRNGRVTITALRQGNVKVYCENENNGVAEITITSEGEHAAYVYSLVPNVNIDENISVNDKWNGMGVGTVSGVNSPGSYPNDTLISDYVFSPPSSYPEITINGKNYRYDVTGTKEDDYISYWTKAEAVKESDGTYSITLNIKSEELQNYNEIAESDNLYVYIREVAEVNQQSTEQIVKLEVDNQVESECYIDGVMVGGIDDVLNYNSSNNSNNTNNGSANQNEDNTVASGILPYAGGITFKIIVAVLVIAFGGFAYYRYKNIDR